MRKFATPRRLHGRTQSQGYRQARLRACLNQHLRAQQSEYAHGNAPDDSPYKRLFKEGGELGAFRCPPLYELQFLPDSRELARHSCDGSWHCRSCLELGRSECSVGYEELKAVMETEAFHRLSPAFQDICLAIKVLALSALIIVNAGFATEGLIKGKLRGRRSYQVPTDRRKAPVVFWFGITLHYAIALLFIFVLFPSLFRYL